jgi:hypothetical protein
MKCSPSSNVGTTCITVSFHYEGTFCVPKTILTHHFSIEVSIPSQASEVSSTCVLGVSFLPQILRPSWLVFGTVLILWYFLLFKFFYVYIISCNFVWQPFLLYTNLRFKSSTFTSLYSGICLIRHTKGPGKCVGLYRMSEPV